MKQAAETTCNQQNIKNVHFHLLWKQRVWFTCFKALSVWAAAKANMSVFPQDVKHFDKMIKLDLPLVWQPLTSWLNVFTLAQTGHFDSFYFANTRLILRYDSWNRFGNCCDTSVCVCVCRAPVQLGEMGGKCYHSLLQLYVLIQVEKRKATSYTCVLIFEPLYKY